MTVKNVEEVTALDTIDIAYTPAKVEFTDFEAFEAGIEQAITKYGTLDLENNTIEEVKEARKNLNALGKKLEDRRKEIKNTINTPYAKFESQYKAPYSKLTQLIAHLKQQIDDYEDNQKSLRRDAVKHYFAVKAKEAKLDVRVFEPYLNDFQKASQFKKDSFELKKTTMTELEEIVVSEIEKQNQRDADLLVITDLCAKSDLGPASYIRQYDTGASLAEVLNLINRDVEEDKRFKQELDIKKQAEANRVTELEQEAQEKAHTQIKAYDRETGEIIEPSHQEESERYTTIIQFWFDIEQAKAFKNFLDSNDIDFKTIESMKKA